LDPILRFEKSTVNALTELTRVADSREINCATSLEDKARTIDEWMAKLRAGERD
jgi:phage gp36-like protein